MWIMADVPLSSRTIVRPYRSRSGSPQIRNFELSTAASTALIAYGQVVSFDLTSSATHRVVRCSTASGQTPILSTSFAGVSAGADTSDGSTLGLGPTRTLPVFVADNNTEFLFPTKLVIASTCVGLDYELSWDSTLSIHHLSANSTAGECTLTVTDTIPGTLGDTGGYFVGRFKSTACSPIVLNR